MAPSVVTGPIRLDRQAEYPIILGESLSQHPSGYSSFKYNNKPTSLQPNPARPTLSPDLTLTFTPPAPAPEIKYTGTASKQSHHFLLFDPTRKVFTLERADAALALNASVYEKLHPAVRLDEDAQGADDESEDDEEGAYDWRNFLGKQGGRVSAMEDKKMKRLGALKRAGKEVVDLPDEDEMQEDEIVIPGAPEQEDEEEREDWMDGISDEDAPGESDYDAQAAPPPPPPPVQKAPKPKAPPKPRAPPKKKAVVEELVLPDPDPAPIDSDDEEIDFSDEDEDDGPPPQQQQSQQEEQQQEDEDDEFDFDIGKELEEALESDHHSPVGLGLVFEDDHGGQGAANDASAARGGPPKSLREMYGGVEDEDEDSESEEE